MNADEFAQFTQTLRCPSEDDGQGYYPQMPWNDRMALLWFRTLARYPAAKVCRALEMHVMAEPTRPPTLDEFVADVQYLMPPPVVPWPQFAPPQLEAMQQGGYGGVLRSLLPQPTSTAWAKCWIWLFEQRLTWPGREAACARECRRFAEEYPRDREDWLRHAWRLEETAAQEAE